MTIEENIFEHKKFITEKLLQYGFHKVDGAYKDSYEYEVDFMEGNFRAFLLIIKENILLGKVIDKMNNEEYTRLRVKNSNDAFVKSVQSAYIALLKEIAEYCCDIVPFVFDQANRISEKISEQYEVKPDFPWAKGRYQNYGVFRHKDTKKWFAIIMNVSLNSLLKNNKNKMIDIINLKVGNADNLQKRRGVYPAYHMNHKNWISITLNDQLKDEKIMELIDVSFNLTHLK